MVTLDMHFADIRVYPPADYYGMIVLRLARVRSCACRRSCGRLLPPLERESLAGKLWIVDETSVRVARLMQPSDLRHSQVEGNPLGCLLALQPVRLRDARYLLFANPLGQVL